MGKFHENWDGFTVVRNSQNKICGAECHTCKRVLVKRDSDTLKNHKMNCKRSKTAQPFQPRNSNVQTDPPVSDLSNSDTVNEMGSEEFETSDDGVNLNKPLDSLTAETTIMSSSISPKKKLKNNDQVNMLVMKFFISTGLEFENISSSFLRESYRLVGIDLPSEDDFKTTILTEACDELCKSNYLYQYLDILTVHTHDAESVFTAVCLALNTLKEYIYVDSIVIDKKSGLIDDNDIKTQLEAFCDQSVKKVKDLYKTIIRYVIYDSLFDLSCRGDVDGNLYYKIVSLSVLIRHLKEPKLPIQFKDFSEFNAYKEFTNTLDDLDKAFCESDCSLGEATEKLMNAINNKNVPLCDAIQQVIMKFMSNVALAANFLNHKYRGHYFIKDTPLHDMLMDFFARALPNDAFEILGDYIDESGAFKVLFKNNSDCTPERFWHIAKVYCKKTLPDFALSMLHIPAIPRKINMHKFLKLRLNLVDSASEQTKKYVNLQISLMINQKK